jgi:hypothetical protein
MFSLAAAALAFSVGMQLPAGCLHGADESATQRSRRQAAIE